MANTIPSTNMGLPIPVVGTDPGPQWATDNNSCLTLIDQHDHSVGYGVQITPSGLNINGDLTFQSNNATNLRTVRLASQTATLALSSDKGCLYEVANDLYFNDGAGTAIRITQSGAVAGTPGSISNLVSPASAAYVSATQTFVFQQAANTSANIDAASYIFRNTTASSKGVTVNAPASLAADYSLTLPASLPASTLPVSLAASGALSAGQITSAQIGTGAIIASNIASGTITTTQIASSTIVASNIASGTITGTQISSNVNLLGTDVLAGSRSIATGPSDLGSNLAIVYGIVSSAGGPAAGAGFSVSKTTGPVIYYTVTFSTAYSATPSVTASANEDGGYLGFPYVIIVYDISTAGFKISIRYADGASSQYISAQFSFIAIGTR